MIKEFKEFALKGNLIDMAVAFVMGAAFGKVVSSFINGIVMPVVGRLTNQSDFKSLKYVISEAVLDANGKVVTPENAITYGDFISVLIDFILVAFFMFLLVKAINKMKRKKTEEAAAAPEPTSQEKLLSEIRDLLKK